MSSRVDLSPKQTWRGAIVASSFMILFGTYLVIISVHNIFFPWTRQDFIEYRATLNGSPHIQKGKSQSLTIKLKEAKSFEFTIDGDNYTVLGNTGYIGNLGDGDSVSVLVDKSQYNSKITKLTPPTFLQNINWKWIRVYEFKDDKQTILDFNDVILELRRVAKFYLVFGLGCWIGSFFYLRYEHRKYVTSKNSNSTDNNLL